MDVRIHNTKQREQYQIIKKIAKVSINELKEPGEGGIAPKSFKIELEEKVCKKSSA